MGRPIEGYVVEVFNEPVSRVIKGKTIKRNGSQEKPAYLVRSKAGNEALKLETELKSSKDILKPKRPTPKMFG
jgi:hypothetical protein